MKGRRGGLIKYIEIPYIRLAIGLVGSKGIYYIRIMWGLSSLMPNLHFPPASLKALVVGALANSSQTHALSPKPWSQNSRVDRCRECFMGFLCLDANLLKYTCVRPEYMAKKGLCCSFAWC